MPKSPDLSSSGPDHIDPPKSMQDLLMAKLHNAGTGDVFRATVPIELQNKYGRSHFAMRMHAYAHWFPKIILSSDPRWTLESAKTELYRPQAFYTGSLLATDVYLEHLDEQASKAVLDFNTPDYTVNDIRIHSLEEQRQFLTLVQALDLIPQVFDSQDDTLQLAILQAAEQAFSDFDTAMARVYEPDLVAGFVYTAGYIESLHEYLN